MPKPPKDTRPQVRAGVKSPGSLNPRLRRRSRPQWDAAALAKGILAGDRVMLGQAITLIESQKAEHQAIAQQVITRCLSAAGSSIRLGITGSPGVGKSTFIEALGQHLVQQDRRLAVLAIDPSSQLSKGSILGDKTRMERLSSDERVFIRPSPAGDSLGGVARKTREAIILCEAAGYDTIVVETVGVGQSETAVHAMVDCFLLLLLPGGGDELQGIKRGIVEMADLVAVNKADGGREVLAQQAARAYRNALHLFPPKESGWTVAVTTCSAEQGTGIAELWAQVQDYAEQTQKNGHFARNRSQQATYWLHETIQQHLQAAFQQSEAVQAQLPHALKAVEMGTQTSFQAAEQLIKLFLGVKKDLT